MATIAEPLRECTRTGYGFKWTQTQLDASEAVKTQMREATTLSLFDSGAPTSVVAGASPVGLGAVLVQERDGYITSAGV